MHGKIIELSREHVNKGERITESDFFDVGFIGHYADYVDSVTEENRRNVILEFLSFLENKRCILNGDMKSFTFDFYAKEKFFLEKFEKFKCLANEITLKDFSNYSTNVYRLQDLLENDDFFIHCDGVFYKVDYFIREFAEDNSTWYFGGVVDYHY